MCELMKNEVGKVNPEVLKRDDICRLHRRASVQFNVIGNREFLTVLEQGSDDRSSIRKRLFQPLSGLERSTGRTQSALQST